MLILVILLRLVMAFVMIKTITRNATMMAEIAVEVAKSLISALTVHVFKMQVSMKTNILNISQSERCHKTIKFCRYSESN